MIMTRYIILVPVLLVLTSPVFAQSEKTADNKIQTQAADNNVKALSVNAVTQPAAGNNNAMIKGNDRTITSPATKNVLPEDKAQKTPQANTNTRQTKRQVAQNKEK